ncbi:MAG: hypothetical protein EBZ36_00805 [Acidobacteria bacterium]|nr:hypothetical protein [Acidobacteriota bacterium]
MNEQPPRPKERIRVSCVSCGEVTETTIDKGEVTILYCLRCRRWCREVIEEGGQGMPTRGSGRRDNRCH